MNPNTPEEKKPQAEEPAQPAPENAPAVEMSEEDEAIVLQRLRELGYVD